MMVELATNFDFEVSRDVEPVLPPTAVADVVLAADGLRMLDCANPDGCVAPGNKEDGYSCEYQNRCVMR